MKAKVKVIERAGEGGGRREANGRGRRIMEKNGENEDDGKRGKIEKEDEPGV